MSGDVQPRKRKDKKRKKDDSTEQIPTQPQPPSSNNYNEDVNIHVHKEDGTGGGICAKIVFFFLFSALAIIIGLIITEHRGLTDLDSVDQESRFSQIFDGWIDNSLSHDDEGDHVENILNHEDDEIESPEVDSNDEQDEKVESEEQSEADDEDDDDDDEEEDITQDDDQTSESNEHESDNDDEYEEKDVDEDEVSDENADDDEEEVTLKDVEDSIEDEDTNDYDNNVDENDEGDDNSDDDVISNESAFEEENISDQSQEKEVDEIEEKETLSTESEEKYEAEFTEKQVSEEKEESEKNEDENQEDSRSVNAHLDTEPKESDKQDVDVENYEYENITNKDDFKIREKIDEAQRVIKNNAPHAIKLFDVLLQNYPSSPRSLYGKAQALDVLAEQRKSNKILQQAIAIYLQLLNLEDIPNVLFETVADRCINRMRFIGNYNRAIDVHKKLIARFPEDPKHRNQLVVSYLSMNEVNKARIVLQETLSKYPNDGFALVHYGFILKTSDNNLNESIFFLKKGIATEAPGVIDGRFYFHLGDALTRLGRNEEAMKVYEQGVQHKLFLSKYQRSLYNIARLKGKPWWEKEETPYGGLYTLLENNWKKIRDEGLSVLSKNDQFQSESENLKDTGVWKQFELFARGRKNFENCKKCPFTCKIIESIPDAKGCRRGQTKFSMMHPGTHVWPHCGPTNCRLRVHLGLNVPPHTYIRVANVIRSWENGKILIFDDSFEHEVWHNGTTFRLVLIVDIWHPELTATEKRTLSPI